MGWTQETDFCQDRAVGVLNVFAHCPFLLKITTRTCKNVFAQSSFLLKITTCPCKHAILHKIRACTCRNNQFHSDSQSCSNSSLSIKNTMLHKIATRTRNCFEILVNITNFTRNVCINAHAEQNILTGFLHLVQIVACALEIQDCTK